MLDLRESDLVAARVPPASMPGLLAAARDAGAAVLPVDDRLPAAAVQRLLARARPTVCVDGSSSERRADGIPVAAGVGLVVATSGSSGEPRLVELGHEAVQAAVEASLARLGARASDGWLCCLPVAHMGGLLVLLRASSLGAPLRFGPFEPGAAFASVVPTQLGRALDAGMDLSGFRALLVGGAPLGSQSAAPVVTTYGLTESCGGMVYDGEPLDGVSLRIGDGDEIQMRGPTLMRGYRLDDAATATAFTADGWLRTRDAGALMNGRLAVFGRLDDAIVSGGEKVWPAPVERVLRAHPSVHEVAVAGRPDPEWGSIVVAYVEPTDPASPPSLDELRAFAREQLAPAAAPREVVIVEQLPRTGSGKVRAPDPRPPC